MINKKTDKKGTRFIKSYSIYLKRSPEHSRGFTLVETLVAVFILTISIASFMSVVTSGLFAAKYARDEITSNYLLQEAVDFIRNDRDTSVILQSNVSSDQAWSNFLDKYSICNASSNGCYINVLDNPAVPKLCNESVSGEPKCPYLYYDKEAHDHVFYTHDTTTTGVVKTRFIRKLVVESGAEEMKVTVTVSWKNGSLTKNRTLKTSLMKWQ